MHWARLPNLPIYVPTFQSTSCGLTQQEHLPNLPTYLTTNCGLPQYEHLLNLAPSLPTYLSTYLPIYDMWMVQIFKKGLGWRWGRQGSDCGGGAGFPSRGPRDHTVRVCAAGGWRRRSHRLFLRLPVPAPPPCTVCGTHFRSVPRGAPQCAVPIFGSVRSFPAVSFLGQYHL